MTEQTQDAKTVEQLQDEIQKLKDKIHGSGAFIQMRLTI